MAHTESRLLSGASETLLIMLYLRAQESQRPDGLIKDAKAEELVTRLPYDFDRIRRIPLSAGNRVVAVLRDRVIDDYVRAFLDRQPQAVVVQLGCGLDTRYERLGQDRRQLTWYDLDLPEVIALRRQFIGGEGEHYHLVSGSVFEPAWPEALGAEHGRPCLFVVEGVFHLFEADQVKSVVLTLRQHFPGAELVFDGFSPLLVWIGNLQVARSRLSARARWGLWHGQAVERWGGGICLLDEWGWTDNQEPRLAGLRWLRHLEFLARTTCVYHFQLGTAPADA